MIQGGHGRIEEKTEMKKVLITGANSYIGTSFENYVKEHYSFELEVHTTDMIDGRWRNKNFGEFDVIFHVAGLAHADVGNVSEEVKKKYYAINTDLAIETAKKAKDNGVRQFVFMSSMIVYGKQEHITSTTAPHPANFYGDSKWKAEKGIRALASDDSNGEKEFVVTILRPPMIYGKGAKGNYPTLAELAKRVPVFPDYHNKRSMLYIENLCEFLAQVMIKGSGGIYWPQNAEYSSTVEIARNVALAVNHRIVLTKVLNPVIAIAKRVPGKVGGLALKAFGDSWYDQDLSTYAFKYQLYSLSESIRRTEL